MERNIAIEEYDVSRTCGENINILTLYKLSMCEQVM